MIRLTAVASVAALALTACNAPPERTPAAPETPAAEAPGTTPQPVEPGTPVSAADKLTADGFGPIRVGQTLAEVEQAFGPPSRPLTDENGCSLFHPVRAPQGLLVMTEGGRVSRVTLSRDATAETDRGLNLGDTAAEVKRVYGAAAQATPHKYQSAPAEYITVWSGGPRNESYVDDASARGLVYEIGSNGTVSAIHGGGPSIQYVEGCS